MHIFKKILFPLLLFTTFTAPLVFYPGISDFTNLPQRIVIETGCLLLALSWLATQAIGNESKTPKLPVFTWVLLAFLCWSLFTVPFTFNTYEGWEIGRQWLTAFLFFFLISQIAVSSDQRRQTLSVMFGAAFLVAILGICQHLFGFSFIPQLAPPAANYANKNMAVHFIVLLFPVGGFLFLTAQRNLTAWLTALMLSLITVYLLYTQTRAGWLAVTIQCLLFAVLCKTTQLTLTPLWSRQKKWALVTGGIIVLTMMNIGPAGFTPGYEAVGLRAASIASVQGNHARFAIWADTISLIKEHPLLGVGLGNLKVHFPSVQKESLFLYTQYLKDAHNDYLQIWAELGLVGLSLFVFFIGSLGVFFYRTYKECRGNLTKTLELLAIALSLVGIGINGLFCFPLERMIPLFTIMVMLGLVASLAREGKPDKPIHIPKRFAAYALIVLLVFAPIMVVDNLKAIAADHFYLKTCVASVEEEWQGVIDSGTKALHYQPDDVTPHSHIGAAYLALDKDTEALPHLMAMLEKFPYHYITLLNTGTAYYSLRDYPKAKEYFAKAVRIAPIAGAAHGQLGKAYWKLKEYPKALAEFNEAIVLDPPKKSTYLYNLGLVERELGHVPEAIGAFERAIAADNDFALPHKELTMIYLQLTPDQTRAEYHAKRFQELSQTASESGQ
ncbi:MAG: tetratricopeptide repeat protein [Proteobacteria bacterium]|nr:tetratricopeptide repeat protein [Pseudomonadota bacterium]